MDYRKEYERWLENVSDPGIIDLLKDMDDAAAEDAFYRELSFGTGGLRGIIGAGTNRMNIYTVAKASQGLADYLNEHFETPSVAVSYDSRIKSDVFAVCACEVFAANGIRVYLYPRLMPTPCLSYAVRKLCCSAGVMITASHNPARYNGYKVYGEDGCQITVEAAAEILGHIKKTDLFQDVKRLPFAEAMAAGKARYIEEDVLTDFIEEVKRQSVLYGEDVRKDAAIVYTPLNGTGLEPVTRVLRESGYTDVTVVKEQEMPDGHFPTCPYPNPEIEEAMELGLQYCEKVNADLLLATDPDCDRCGIAVRTDNGYRLLTGNETGILLLDYICAQRVRHQCMPEDPVFVKTIVTSDLAEKVAATYGVRTVNVLTGFKFIGEVIGNLEKQGKESSYICGYEESYGYLTGTYVRDKDAVNAAFMIAEMFAYYQTKGIRLIDRLNEIYDRYGYSLNTLHSYAFEGSAGMAEMARIMKKLRGDVDLPGGQPVLQVLDYSLGIDGLPKSDVLKYILENGTAVVRPSGTEPKLKIYISVSAEDKLKAADLEKNITGDLERIIHGR